MRCALPVKQRTVLVDPALMRPILGRHSSQIIPSMALIDSANHTSRLHAFIDDPFVNGLREL